RRKRTGQQDELLGAPLADNSRQRLRAPAPGHDSERHLREGELRCFRRIREVAVQDELQASSIGGTVDRRYHRSRAVAYCAKHALEDLMLRAPLLGAERIALLQVGAGAKRFVARSRDDDAAASLFGLEVLEKFTQLKRGAGVERVGDLGAVERRQNYIVRPLLDPQRLALAFHPPIAA